VPATAEAIPALGPDPVCILVTGASGFIGSHLVGALAGEATVVRAGVRKAKPSPAPNVRECRCDLDNADEIRDAVAGARIVVHAAYRSVAAMHAQCRALLDAMSAAGVSDLVFLSSISVYGDADGEVGEDAPLRGDPGDYALAKRHCEESIRQWVAEQPQRRAVILRPGIVYGAHSALWVDKMRDRIRCGGWGTFGAAGDGFAALIHVDDLAALTLRACALLAQPAPSLPGVSVVNAVGPEPPTWNDYFQALAAADGQPPLRPWSRGELGWRMAAGMLAKVWRKAGLPGGRCAALAPTQGELRLFALRARYTVANAEDLLGFTARIGLQDGLRRTLAAD